MCGIVGIVGNAPVAPLIVDALKRLEYRGYDSAGVATIERGELVRRRAEGKLINLERRLKSEPLDGTIGIGHTRWATHGVPNETNAHPAFLRRRRHRPQRHHRELFRIARGAAARRLRIRLADRHRGGRPSRRARTRAWRKARRCGPQFAEAAAGRLRARHHVHRRRRPDRRRPQRPAACRRPRRGRDVPGLRRHRAGALHQFDHLSGGWRLGGRAPQRVRDLRHGRQQGRAQAAAVARHLLHGRQGQPPPFHGEGNP